MKPIIKLLPLEHRGAEHIGIAFEFNTTVKELVKKLDGVRWSQTHRMFYIADTLGTMGTLFEYFKKAGFYVDYNAIKGHTAKTKSVVKTNTKSVVKTNTKEGKIALYAALTEPLKDLLKGYILFLRGKRLSEQTIKSYGYFVLRFMHRFKDVPVNEWNVQSIDRFMEDVIARENYSISSHRQCVSAFKYMTAFVEMPQFDASNYKRPKKSLSLPTVLSKEEIIALLRVTKNLKHRTVLGLIYSGGLRIGELLALKINALDFDRRQITVRMGKGRKDRVVGMSEVMIPLLLNYLNTYQPKDYIIEGRDGGMYSAVSIRSFLKSSCKSAGIKKDVTPHSLRHSYATHMLENGVDIRYIQELLGHSKPETTMIYTHVAQKTLMQISNPLDVAVKQLTENAKEQDKVSISRQIKG